MAYTSTNITLYDWKTCLCKLHWGLYFCWRSRARMFDYGACFGGMFPGYASGYASYSVQTKTDAFLESMLRGMRRLSRTSQPYINWTLKAHTHYHPFVYFDKCKRTLKIMKLHFARRLYVFLKAHVVTIYFSHLCRSTNTIACFQKHDVALPQSQVWLVRSWPQRI